MVLLTMTQAIVSALASRAPTATSEEEKGTEERQSAAGSKQEPSLSNPSIGDPISHNQILELHSQLKEASDGSFSLEELLRGAKVYVPPPPPKPAKSKEYLELMARLRREEEARAYERMLNPPAPLPAATQPYLSANSALPDDLGDDTSILHSDVHRQLTLLLNFLVSIIGVAGTLWIAARWWSTPARLFLTMGGSVVVGVAEVVVYQLWVWKMGEAKKGQEMRREKREVVKTWVVDKDGEREGGEAVVVGEEKDHHQDRGVRRRLVGEKEEEKL